jgi:hypothetical protein
MPSNVGGNFQTAFSVFRRVLDSTEQVQGGKTFNRAAYYRLLWAYYANDIFESTQLWGYYRSQFRLYRQIRALYNPVRRLCDFYGQSVYPGVLTLDGERLPEGVPLAIPLADDIDPALRAALGQFWRWTNMQALKGVIVRYGAIAGNVLVELLDDPATGKVTAGVVWPSLIQAIDQDRTGNVLAYTLRYLATDDDGYQYEYRKEVDKASIATYRDGEPHSYDGGPAVTPNPYGFVPAVWCKHREIGGNFGAPAIHGSIGKLDELNSLASHAHDQIHKVIEAPMVLWTGGGGLKHLVGKSAKRGATDEMAFPVADRESVQLLQGPADGKTSSLVGNLPLAEAVVYMTNLVGEIEQDHPELAMYRELRAMSQVTGPAAARLMGDVGGLVQETAAGYDHQMIKLCQMAVAIAGWRLASGDWGPPNRHQEAFRPFDLGSYARGDLDFDISPRPLIPQTRREQLDNQRAELALQADRIALLSLAVPGQAAPAALSQAGVGQHGVAQSGPATGAAAPVAQPTPLALALQKLADRNNAKELEGPTAAERHA